MRIRDGKNSDPGSGMEKIRIRDPGRKNSDPDGKNSHPGGSATLVRSAPGPFRSFLCVLGLLHCLNTLLFSVDNTVTRVSSKQTKIIFGSNRNKPKQDLFRVCFGLFRETKKKKFRFVSVFRTYIETTETNRTVS
jgi:hypothetical protein